jgi:hypothetical protein
MNWRPAAGRGDVKKSTLQLIAPILSVLRAHPTLHEVRPTAFHLDGRDFLHFHEEADGVFADVRLSKGFVRMPVSSEFEQSEFLARIDEVLSSLEAHRPRKRSGHDHR